MTTNTLPADYVDFTAANKDKLTARKWGAAQSKDSAAKTVTNLSLIVGLVSSMAMLGFFPKDINGFVGSALFVLIAATVTFVSFKVMGYFVDKRLTVRTEDEAHDMEKVLEAVQAAGWELDKEHYKGQRSYFIDYHEGRFKNAEGIAYYFNHVSFSPTQISADFRLVDEEAITQKNFVSNETRAQFLADRWEKENGAFRTVEERAAFKLGVIAAEQ